MTTSTKLFHYNPESRTFSAEISTLEAQPNSAARASVFHQVYPNSADQGLTLVSHVTGREVDYVVDHTIRHDGEIQGWTLIPTKQSLRRCPEARGTKIQLFND